MIAMALSLARPLFGEHAYLVFNWFAVISGFAITFAAPGLVFKASIDTIVGQLIAWAYDRLL